MAALADDHPLRKTYEQAVDFEIYARGFKKFAQEILGNFKLFEDFLKEVKSSIQVLAATVGNSAVNVLVSAGARVVSLIRLISSNIQIAFDLVTKIVKVIQKTADPKKAIKPAKALCARFAKAFRKLASFVGELANAINPIYTVLKTIETFKNALKFVLKWIVTVTSVSKMMKKVMKVSQRLWASVKVRLREVTLLVKDVNKVKLA